MSILGQRPQRQFKHHVSFDAQLDYGSIRLVNAAPFPEDRIRFEQLAVFPYVLVKVWTPDLLFSIETELEVARDLSIRL